MKVQEFIEHNTNVKAEVSYALGLCANCNNHGLLTSFMDSVDHLAEAVAVPK